MDELISRNGLYMKVADMEREVMQKLLETPQKLHDGSLNPMYMYYQGKLLSLTNCKDMIYDEPAVDAVPVVRCKDCKSAYRLEVYSPSIKCEITGNILTTEDYCSLGERRTKDE